MLDIVEISIEEFETTIYDKYITLFPENEQRYWYKISKTYDEEIERFYKITVENDTIGFFMLERIDDNHPYYIDYFGIFKEYQNKGYGTLAMKKLIEMIGDSGICLEIEKEDKNEPHTKKRAEFYKRLGFKEMESIYLLYDVLYTPYIYKKENNIDKKEADKIMFDCYITNAGITSVKKHCKIIK